MAYARKRSALMNMALYRWSREHGFDEGLNGTRMLREALDYCVKANDPQMSIVKEIYGHVARVYGGDAKSVERSIRAAIKRSDLADMTNGRVIRCGAAAIAEAVATEEARI